MGFFDILGGAANLWDSLEGGTSQAERDMQDQLRIQREAYEQQKKQQEIQNQRQAINDARISAELAKYAGIEKAPTGLTPEEMTAAIGTTEGGINARIANERERLARSMGEAGLAGSPALTAALTGLQEGGIQQGANVRIQTSLADVAEKRRQQDMAKQAQLNLDRK